MFSRRTPRLAIRMWSVVFLASVLALIGAAPAAGLTANPKNFPAWVWPVANPHPVLRPFVAPETPYSTGHRGIDIAAPVGSAVRAPAAGIVHFSGFVVDRNLISIDHGGGIISSFEPVLSHLSEGTLVHRGEKIGVLQSGHCRTPCLHLGARSYGKYVSPLNFLGGIPYSVLLPTRPLP